jgi:hypothetical protein
MIAYHRTTSEAVQSIIRDATGSYGTEKAWSGVWISDEPLDANEGTNG